MHLLRNMTVVIGMMQSPNDIFMYQPVTSTLAEGFSDLGARVLIGAGAHSLGTKAMELTAGDAFISEEDLDDLSAADINASVADLNIVVKICFFSCPMKVQSVHLNENSINPSYLLL